MSRNKNKTFIYTTISVVIIFILACCIGFIKITTLPEYALYKTCTSIKDHNFNEFSKYVNIDKIVENRAKAAIDNLSSKQGFQNSPFLGFAYIFMDEIKSKMKSTINNNVKNLVQGQYNMFEDVPRAGIVYFLIVKSVDNYSLKVKQSDNTQIIYVLSDAKKNKDVNITLDNSNNAHWEIVDISGFNFLKDKLF